MPMMRVKDLEKLQATLNQAGYDYQLELEEGIIHPLAIAVSVRV